MQMHDHPELMEIEFRDQLKIGLFATKHIRTGVIKIGGRLDLLGALFGTVFQKAKNGACKH